MRSRGRVSFGSVLLALAVVAGCSNKDGPTPPCVVSATGSSHGQMLPQGQMTLKCTNSYGSVTVLGGDVKDGPRIDWYLAKTAWASSLRDAQGGLEKIFPDTTRVGDTLKFDAVTATMCSPDVGLTFNPFPPGMNFVADSTVGRVEVSYLLGASISLLRHNGPFYVRAIEGAIFIEAAVPDSGRATTGKGNIELHLPASSSVALFVMTERGAITVIGLPLMGRVDSTGFLSGTLGAGTDTIRLETKDGDITLKALPSVEMRAARPRAP